ncbi:MAG: kynureninase [Chitinophagales bacterium]|nr:kynureninase [Chitinophagales bacterium]
MQYSNSLSFAQSLDANDLLKKFRSQFHFPKVNGKEVIYLTGNSLGLLPKSARQYVEQEFIDWENYGVEAHFDAKNPWFYYHHFHREALAKIVGAKKDEVVAMGSLTANLHLLLVSFYQPTKERYKIMMEANAFPSDQYAVETQVRFHGYNPDDAIIEIKPREGEYTLRTEDILKAIDENKDQLATIMFGGVNYLSGQLFDIKAITEAGHRACAFVGFDLAHAAGNVPVKLHDCNVDFACWCTYKYLNSGAGGVGGIFIHEKHANNFSVPRFAGWWGNEESTRFEMKKGFVPQTGAAGWQVSNAPVFNMAIHRASLELFEEAGIENLRKKSELLTGFLEFIIEEYNAKNSLQALKIITPKNVKERGCQLSFIATAEGKEIFNQLSSSGIVCDWREPNPANGGAGVIRMAPVPLYNSFEDVFRTAEALGNL